MSYSATYNSPDSIGSACVEAAIWARLSSMSLASRIKPQILAADAPSLMISCGLALRGFDA